MSADPKIIEMINQALDRERSENALPNEVALAQHIGVSPKTLSFWRNGRISRKSEIIVRLIVPQTSAEHAV